MKGFPCLNGVHWSPADEVFDDYGEQHPDYPYLGRSVSFWVRVPNHAALFWSFVWRGLRAAEAVSSVSDKFPEAGVF